MTTETTQIEVPLLNFTAYSPLALRTAKPLPAKQQRSHAEIGLITELGELADCYKRWAVYGKPLDFVNVMEECADAFWYAALWLNTLNIAPALGDEAWHDSAEYMAQPNNPLKDPWEAVEFIKALAALGAVLAMPVEDRGSSDKASALIVLTMLCVILRNTPYTLEHACHRNIQKLAKRFGDSFSEYAALNRDVAAERVVLES